MNRLFCTVQEILDLIAAQPGLDPALADVLAGREAKQNAHNGRRFAADPVRHSAMGGLDELAQERIDRHREDARAEAREQARADADSYRSGGFGL